MDEIWIKKKKRVGDKYENTTQVEYSCETLFLSWVVPGYIISVGI